MGRLSLCHFCVCCVCIAFAGEPKVLPNKAPLVSNEDMVLNAIKTCISELRMASHRSHLPILNYSAAVQRSAYCMADMAEEQEGEAGHERCLGKGVQCVGDVKAIVYVTLACN